MSVNTQHHLVCDPEPGDVVHIPPGTHLEVKFRRRGLGLSRWQVEDRPSYLVPLQEEDHDFSFLVFSAGETAQRALRLVRSRPDRPDFGEVRDLTVLVTG
jgi:hypothetical protein